jgi:hypothetical protein
MSSAALQISYNRQRTEAELLQQVQQASYEFRSASEETRAAARDHYAEILGTFTELLLGNVNCRTFQPISRASANQPGE